MENYKQLTRQKNVRRIGRIDHDIVVFADGEVNGATTVAPVATMQCQHTILWDRVDAFIAKRLGDHPDFRGVFHKWSDETREVEVGYRAHGAFEDAPEKSLVGARVYETELVYPEGVYVVGLAREDIETLREFERRLGDLPAGIPWDLQYEVIGRALGSFMQPHEGGGWRALPSELTPLPSSLRETQPAGTDASALDPASID